MRNPTPAAPRLVRQRWLVLGLAALVTVVCAGYCWHMPVSTSRRALVRDDDPDQARWRDFEARFGSRDNLVVVLRGGTAATRRDVARRLCAAFERDPELTGRTHCGLALEHVIELGALWRPEVLSRDLGSVVRVVEHAADAIEEAVGPEGQPNTVRTTTPTTGAVARSGLGELALGLRILDEQLGPEPPPVPKSLINDDGTEPGVDEAGYFVTEDGAAHLIVLTPHLDSDEGAVITPMVERVRAIRDSVPRGEVRVDVTGLPAFAADELALVRRGLWTSSVASAVGVTLILLLALRSWLRALLAVVPLGVGVVATLAFARWWFGGLNLITSAFVSVLFGLGIDFAVYVLMRHTELRRTGTSPERAAFDAVRLTAPAIVVGASTTAVAFGLLATTRFSAYAELGIIVTCGLGLTLVATLTLLPLLLDAAAPWLPLEREEKSGHNPLAHILGRHARPLIACSLVAVVALTIGVSRLTYNPRYFDFVPPATESGRALRVIEGDGRFGPIFANTVVDSIEGARARAEVLRALPEVAAVDSPSDALPPLTPDRLAAFAAVRATARSRATALPDLVAALDRLGDALDELRFAQRSSSLDTAEADQVARRATALRERLNAAPASAELWLAALDARVAGALDHAHRTAQSAAVRGRYEPGALPLVLEQRYASADRTAVTLYVRPAGNIWDQQTARAFATQVSAVAPDAVGLAMNVELHTRMILGGFTSAAGVALVLIALIVALGMRRVSDTLLALTPLAIGFVCTLGAMGWAGITLDAANIVVLPLLLGIGVDAGAHIMHRTRQSEAEHGQARLDDVVGHTGSALAAASLSTMAGFAALLLGDYGAMRSLGATMTLGVGLCLFASGILLPSLLVALRRAR